MAQPKGILLVSEVYPPAIGGSGVLLENLYTRLDGIAVRVLAHGDSTWRMQNGLRVDTVSMIAPDWGLRTPAAGVRYLRVARRIRQASTALDVIHCGRALPEGLSALLSGRPYACWLHGEELGYASTSRELKWLMRHVYRRASAILANSHNSARLLDRWGVDATRITVIHPGVDHTRFHPAADGASFRKTLAPHGEVLLLSVGRLQRRKGHDRVLSALAGWTPQDPPVRYAIAGDGECRRDLEQRAQALGLGDRVTFLGAVGEQSLPALYAASDIFVMPNRDDGVDFEGFGIVFLEAAATGKPTIGGRSGGVVEAVADSETGLLVDGENVAQLTTALKRLAGDPSLRRALGEAGRRRVLEQFTWAQGAHSVRQLQLALSVGRRTDE